jgi:hypothetical protein
MEFGISVFPAAPADRKAIVFTRERHGADPTGIQDNTAALQRAVDLIEAGAGAGILFIPEGTYRFAGTVNLWKGIRLIGFGVRRPVFFVSDHTPAFAGPESTYVIHFRVDRPGPGQELRDAQNTTFFSGVRNVDFRLGEGNPGLVACRFRVAQLCSIEDVDFHMRDNRAAVEMIGNEMERCRFFGGQYGILTGETVPYWPFYLGDCEFSGQARACISSYRAGLSMRRVRLADAPYGIFVPNKERDNHYIEEFERLYLQDCRMENLQAGISMNMVRYPQNWLHVRDVACRNVPRFFESFAYQYNRHIGVPHIEPEHPVYTVNLDMGLRMEADGETLRRGFDMRHSIVPNDMFPAMPEPQTVLLPDPSSWVNLRELGAAGDGIADDTDVLEQAIAAHAAIYLPQGVYRITRGVQLRPDTALLGLHCSRTRIVLDDGLPGFDDAEVPRSMIRIPEGGKNHVSGLCFVGGRNPGVIQVEWLGAPESIMEDCLFDFGGHGVTQKGKDRHSAIWVRNGGAGEFKNLWIPDVWTRDGFRISDTDAPGQIWMISVEHHLEVEVVLERVSNWRIIALQTEENLGSEKACSLRMEQCRDIEIANLFQYRVQAIGETHPYAAYLNGCHGVDIHGIHCFSIGPCPFENAALINGRQVVRDVEIGTLHVDAQAFV